MNRVLQELGEATAEGIKRSFSEMWPWLKISLTLKAIFLLVVFCIWLSL